MILDDGILTAYSLTNTAPLGGKPVYVEKPVWMGWYKALSFETSPARPTPDREEVRTDARVRIHQNRAIQNHARVDLGPFGGRTQSYRVTRAFHGTDDESGQPITDLSLEVIAP